MRSKAAPKRSRRFYQAIGDEIRNDHGQDSARNLNPLGEPNSEHNIFLSSFGFAEDFPSRSRTNDDGARHLQFITLGYLGTRESLGISQRMFDIPKACPTDLRVSTRPVPPPVTATPIHEVMLALAAGLGPVGDLVPRQPRRLGP